MGYLVADLNFRRGGEEESFITSPWSLVTAFSLFTTYYLLFTIYFHF